MTQTAELTLYSNNEAALSARVDKLGAAAERAVIDSEETARSGTDLARLLRQVLKSIDDDRKLLTEPINGFLRQINTRYKQHSTRADDARKVIDDKLLEWKRAEADRIRREREAEERRLEAERRKLEEAAKREAEQLATAGDPQQAEMVLKAAAETALPMVVIKDPQPTRGNSGTASTRKVWTFELLDFAALPDRYKLTNAPEINAAIREGEREIPGLRIYQDEKLTVR